VDPATNIVNAWDDLPASFTAIGGFQGWNNADPATTLVDTGKGLRVKTYVVAAAGNYSGRITKTGTWDRGFGIDGRSTDGSRATESINVGFTVYHDNDPVALLLDGYNGRMAFVAPPAGGAGHDGSWCSTSSASTAATRSTATRSAPFRSIRPSPCACTPPATT